MTTVNMHEATSRLSQLVKSVEDGEVVFLPRNGQRVAEIHRHTPPPSDPIRRNRIPDLRLRTILGPGYDPAEPLRDHQSHEEYR